MSLLAGWKIRIGEKSGTTLKHMLVKFNPWAGPKCGRKACILCRNTEGDSKCFKRNVLYESQCLQCKKAGKETIYVGETSRTGYERGREHEEDGKKEKDESHMWTHARDIHDGDKPKFSFRVAKTFQSALTRQVSESVRITAREKRKEWQS